MIKMKGDEPMFVYDDGGRVPHMRDKSKDCAIRAIAIATKIPYSFVYGSLKVMGVFNSRGTDSKKVRNLMDQMGWTWVPTMTIGSGCHVHLDPDELPGGRLVVALSKHWTAMIDGVVHDDHDPSRGRTRCVYGYFIQL